MPGSAKAWPVPDYHLSRRASRDLDEIAAYLLRTASEETAIHVEERLFREFEELVRLPFIGHPRRDVTQRNLLFHRVFRYLIVFRRKPQVVIVRVIHGMRDLPRRL